MIKKSLFLSATLCLMALAFSSCKGGTVDVTDPNEQLLVDAVPQFVNNTVIVTYSAMADETIDLYDALVALKADPTNNAKVEAAAAKWLEARKYWELSEAFLFGAASDFGIDPHIDTWPLDRTALVNTLNNAASIAEMDSEDGPAWAGEKLGPSLLGFHAIEYILFANGTTREATTISANELIYAVAVGGDLRNQCIRLEASWAGYDNVSPEKQEIIDEFELGITFGTSSYYGSNMLMAGQVGSTYRTILDANEAIIEGCITIADEVGTMKIGKPHTGADPNYLESPYSFNSKVDFIDNIKSIRNAYLGGADENNRGASVSAYVAVKDADADQAVKAGIENAIAKIQAIPYPFDQNYTSDQAGDAMDACNELATLLTNAKNALRK